LKREKSLGFLDPEISKEWHPTKNGELTPFDFSKGSRKKVWWQCSKKTNHEWEAKIADRKNGTGYPDCYKDF
tara:strand:+ start:208 stop:423 length:216 start_codon:yes stop_codon:yes gene_type:complete